MMATTVPYLRRHYDATYSSAPASVTRIKHSMEDGFPSCQKCCFTHTWVLLLYKGVCTSFSGSRAMRWGLLGGRPWVVLIFFLSL